MGIESHHPTTATTPSSSTASRKGKQAVFDDPTIETNISKDDTATTTSSPDTTMDSDSGEQHQQQQQQMMTTACRSLLEDEDDDTTEGDENSELKSILQQQQQRRSSTRDPSPTGSYHSEKRDEPQPLMSPSPIPDNGGSGYYSGFDPLPRLAYNQEWEIFNPSSVCSQGILPGCNVHFADQLDMMTNCQHPFAFFGGRHGGFVDDQVLHEIDEENAVIHHPAYMLPQTCEYCNADSTDNCKDDCQRPKLFFKKRRPPFCKPGPQWDPVTDYAIENKEVKDSNNNDNHKSTQEAERKGQKTPPSSTQSSPIRKERERRPSLTATLMSGIFGSTNSIVSGNNDADFPE